MWIFIWTKIHNTRTLYTYHVNKHKWEGENDDDADKKSRNKHCDGNKEEDDDDDYKKEKKQTDKQKQALRNVVLRESINEWKCIYIVRIQTSTQKIVWSQRQMHSAY